jgi:hypothetical protein
VKDGSKTFEVRKNDRGFQPGDTVELLEWDPKFVKSSDEAYRGYTVSAPLIFKIGYVFVLDAEHVVFSLLPPDKE